MIRLITTLLLTALFIGSNSLAQDLQDILESKELQRYENNEIRHNNRKYQNDTWLTKGENFSDLFLTRDGPKLLHLWLDTPNLKFKLLDKKQARLNEYITQSKIYRGPSKVNIEVRVLVPHPRYEDMAKYKLLDSFADIQPPRLKVEDKENVKINGFDANIYSLKDSGDVIILTLSKSTLVTIHAKTGGRKDLIDLANLLSFDRLERKLRT